MLLYVIWTRYSMIHEYSAITYKKMWFCVYLVITADNANNNSNPGFRNVQCDTSDYEWPGLIVNSR